MTTRTWWRLCLLWALALVAGCGEPEQSSEPQGGSGVLVRHESALGETFGSRGKQFWLAFPTNYNQTPTLTVFITGETATTGTVNVPSQGFTSNFNVMPGQVTSVVIPAASQLATYGSVEAKGVQVTANADVTVYGLNRIQYTTDAFLGLPVGSLGTDYMVLAYPSGGFASQLAVVATQDATRVTVTPSVATTSGQPAGVPFSVTLNQGQTYQLTTSVSAGDLSGTAITSDKPVGVYGGNRCANIPSSGTGYCDFVVEQLPPTTAWGKSFVSMPLATRKNGDTFRFVASTNSTQVSVNGTVVATLNRGQVHQRIISGPAAITATQPILVAQYSNGSAYDGVASDPFMMLIPPYEQFLTEYTMTTPASGFAGNYLNVVVPSSAIGSVVLDGAVLAASRFQAIGTSGFSGAQISVALGSHRLTSPLPIGAFMYGFDKDDSYGYPGGMSLAPVASVKTVTLSPKTASLLVQNQHCATVSVKDQNGQPLGGVRVDLAVTGAHALTSQGNTDTAGGLVWCYTGTKEGTDTLKASVGTVFDTATVTWRINRPPVVSAGPSVSGYTNNLVQLTGSATDADGDVLSMFWDVTAGASPGTGCSFYNVNTPNLSFTCDKVGVYTVTFIVSDGVNPPVSSSTTVTLSNRPPVVSAGPDVETVTGQPVELQGSASDADGDGLAFWWSLTEQPPNASGCSIATPDQPSTTVLCDAMGVYTFTLTVSDRYNPPVSSTVHVTVINHAPGVDAGPDVTGFTNDTVMLRGAAVDMDGDALTLSWSYTRGDGVEPWATCTFGTPGDSISSFSCTAEGVYTVTLTANDGRNPPVSSSAKVTFTNASKVTMCNLTRYTKSTSMKLCGYTTYGTDASGLSSVWFTVDGGAPIYVVPEPSGGFVSTYATLTEGTHDIRLYALSTKGHITVKSKTVTVDLTAPKLQVLSPTSADVLKSTVVDVTSSVEDATPVTVTTQLVKTSTVESGTGTVTHTIDLVNRGYSTLLVQARDAAGNVTEVRTRVYVQ